MGSCLSKKNVSVSLPANPKSEPRKESEEETHDVKTEIERRHCPSGEEKSEPEEGKNAVVTSNGGAVRVSSCTKEELDAILIQCGRLSRSNSGNPARKHSGSKRSYDFDGENGGGAVDGDEGDAVARERETRRRSQGRRRTPSREREQRSGSRERGGRRVSKSPGRRSESPITTNPNSNSTANTKPGKMISVPATVPSSGGVTNNDEPVKRIHAKKNVGGSPRTRSPARVRGSNENQNSQPISLSRSGSRKAEHSPYRRNPLAEIDNNIISQKPNANSNHNAVVNSTRIALNVVSSSGPENPKDQLPVARTLSNPSDNTKPSSYTALLLKDIQNFHHKKTIAFLKTSKMGSETKDPILESEVVANDDLTKTSFKKYVTVKRGSGVDDDVEDLESSGSNSFSGRGEPNSAELNDILASSSRSVIRPVASGMKVSSEKKRVADNRIGGASRGRVGKHSSNAIACSAGGST